MPMAIVSSANFRNLTDVGEESSVERRGAPKLTVRLLDVIFPVFIWVMTKVNFRSHISQWS